MTTNLVLLVGFCLPLVFMWGAVLRWFAAAVIEEWRFDKPLAMFLGLVAWMWMWAPFVVWAAHAATQVAEVCK